MRQRVPTASPALVATPGARVSESVTAAALVRPLHVLTQLRAIVTPLRALVYVCENTTSFSTQK